MHKPLTLMAAVTLVGALALPIGASAAAKQDETVSNGAGTKVSSPQARRHRSHRVQRTGYGRPFYYRPWGYPYYSYRPYWGGPGDFWQTPGPYWGGRPWGW